MMSDISTASNNGPLEVVIGLIFVVVLIFVLAWIYKRFGNAGLGMGGLIRVVAAMSLGSRDRIALISVGEQQILLGISPGRITKLHVFEEPIDRSAQLASHSGGGSSKGSTVRHEFAEKLQSLISGSKA